MATVVDFHGLRVNVGFERGFVVRQIGQFVGHNIFELVVQLTIESSKG
jgi:hypothetical protein